MTTRTSTNLGWFFIKLLLFVSLAGLLNVPGPVGEDTASAQSQKTNHKNYLPLISQPPEKQVMLGVYTDHYLGLESTIINEVKAIDTWSGKRLSIVGTFIGIEDKTPSYNQYLRQLRRWDLHINRMNTAQRGHLAENLLQ